MASPSTAAQPVQGPSKFYRLVMTPLIFVSFLFSLAWVEFRYSLMRSHTHTGPDGDRSPPHRIPPWLHRILYRPQTQDGRDTHYHSMQRKLLKMETEEAFRIRTMVLCVMGLLLAGLAWMATSTALLGVEWLGQLVS